VTETARPRLEKYRCLVKVPLQWPRCGALPIVNMPPPGLCVIRTRRCLCTLKHAAFATVLDSEPWIIHRLCNRSSASLISLQNENKCVLIPTFASRGYPCFVPDMDRMPAYYVTGSVWISIGRITDQYHVCTTMGFLIGAAVQPWRLVFNTPGLYSGQLGSSLGSGYP
jgi:hypothetical protein